MITIITHLLQHVTVERIRGYLKGLTCVHRVAIQRINILTVCRKRKRLLKGLTRMSLMRDAKCKGRKIVVVNYFYFILIGSIPSDGMGHVIHYFYLFTLCGADARIRIFVNKSTAFSMTRKKYDCQKPYIVSSFHEICRG